MTIQYIPVSGELELSMIKSLLAAENLPAIDPERCDTIIGALDDDRIVGCAAIERYGDDALLRSVVVHSDYRSRGLGSELTRRMIARSRETGHHQMYLLTTTADDYFGGFGFQQVTREEVAPAVRQSTEFTTSCPDSARVYRLDLSINQPRQHNEWTE